MSTNDPEQPDAAKPPKAWGPGGPGQPGSPTPGGTPLPPPMPDAAGGPEPATSALVARHAGEIELPGDSMPVLEAFQDFLEAERRRSRNRMIVLSSVFALVLIGVVFGGGAVFLSMLNPVHTEVQDLQADVGVFTRQTERANRRVDDVAARINRQERLVRDELAREKQAMAEARTAVRGDTEALKAELAHLQEVVKALREDAALKTGGVGPRRAAPEAQADGGTGDQNATSAADPGTDEPSGLPPRAEGNRVLSLSVQPPTGPFAVTFRLPLPE